MRPLLRNVIVLVLTTTLAGCISTRQLRCEARGGRPWTHYRTAHFDVYSDADREQVELLTRRLERLLAQIVVGLGGQGAEAPQTRVRVVALRDIDLFMDLAQPGLAAYFQLDRGGVAPTIVLPVEMAEVVPQVVGHELTHYVSRYFYPRQPLWFGEGLASYFETLAAGTPTKGDGWVGGVDPYWARGLARAKLMEPRALLTATSYPHVLRGSHFHLTSWFLYLWLRNERPNQLAAFQRRLEELEPPEAAWKAAFPELDPASDVAMATLAASLKAFRTSGSSEAWAVVAEYDPRIRSHRHVPAPEVHGVLRTARGWMRGTREEVMARYLGDLEEQLAEAPLDPEALLTRAILQRRSPVPELRQAVEARPEDWRAWYSLAGSLLWEPPAAEAPPEGTPTSSPAAASKAATTDAEEVAARARMTSPEREAALRRALALAPDEGAVMNDLAWLLHLTDRPGEALPLARRAVQLRPLSPAHLDTLAQVSADLGRCGEALLAGRRAAAQHPGLEESLQKLQARCPVAPPGSPGSPGPATTASPASPSMGAAQPR